MGKLRSGTESSLPESSGRPGTPLKNPVSLPGPSCCFMAVCIPGAGGGAGSWAHGLSIMEEAGSLDLQVMDEHVVRSLLDVRP